jgi:excinuclease UvrABC nuclease subunit
VREIFGEKLPKAKASAEDAGVVEEDAGSEKSAQFKLTDIEGVGPKVQGALIAAGYDTLEKIKSLSAEDLTQIDGIGKKTAEKIVNSTKEI